MRGLVVLLSTILALYSSGQDLMKSDSVIISFISDAPLELISAESEMCSGLLDPNTSRFAFKVKLKSFEGFNSPLQREHFNENYMESEKFPEASFSGRILDPTPIEQGEKVKVRVKGDLKIHGISQERLIEVELKLNTDETLTFYGEFEVLLEDHEISIPRIVYQKIAEIIKVKISGILR